MQDNTSKKKFNRNSITIKVNPSYTINAFGNCIYNPEETEIKHDALQVLLNNANSLRNEYGFNTNDLELINQWVAKQNKLINEMSYFLEKSKEVK